MTKKLNWRLAKLPTPDEIVSLVNAKLLTEEEAKQVLFSEVEERDTKSLEDEIIFLRTLVEKLSQNKTQIIETIKQVQVPYYQCNWYKPYEVWCSSSYANNVNDCLDDRAVTSINGTTYLSTNNAFSSFTDLKTF